MLGLKILHCSNVARTTNIWRYRANFGVSPLVCSIMWSLLVEFLPEIVAKASHDHFLWACIMLKTYATKNDMTSKLGGNNEKVSKWDWKLVECIGELAEVVVNVFSQILKYGSKLTTFSYLRTLD